MKVVSCKEMREIDQKTINEYGIPGERLMGQAGVALFNDIKTMDESYLQHIVILCGPGNNGGDGFTLAKLLLESNYDVTCYSLIEEKSIKGDALFHYELLKEDAHVICEPTIEDLVTVLKESTCVVDCIFGTGLKRSVEGYLNKVIDAVNTYSHFTVAVDIPSGIAGDDGEVMGCAIKAHATLILQLPKLGNILYPGKEYNGIIKVLDIGIPNEVIGLCESSLYTYDSTSDASDLLPFRGGRCHKGSFGKVNLIMGSRLMPGACILASRSAYAIGAGLVRNIVPNNILSVVQSGVIEAISFGYDEYNDISMDLLEGYSVLGFGSGLGQDEGVINLLEDCVKNCTCPVVIDADGLNALAKDINILADTHAQVIVTPHLGEMMRLTGYEMDYIQENMVAVVKEFSSTYGVICVLKDAVTLVGHPDGRVYINQTGNHALSKAGSGDVLTGIICGLIAQGMEPMDAAVSAVFCHGKGAQLYCQHRNGRSMMATDLIEALGGL